MKKDVTLALALGGGSALGFAHIGFLQILEENKIKVNAIAGTSMGALVGAFYAAGFNSKELEYMALEKVNMFKMVGDINAIGMVRNGLFSGKRVKLLIEELIGDLNIEDLKIPYTATAVDMLSGKPYNFTRGSVAEAVRTSISVPGVFSAIKKDNMYLVDGGVLNNVPADIAKDYGCDVTISVDVLGEYKMSKPPKNTITLLMAVFSLQQRQFLEMREKIEDLYIDMNLDEVKLTSYDKKSIKNAIMQGRKYGEKFLPEIKGLIEKKQTS